MIYVDASVMLSRLLAEDISPPAALWEAPLISSRLLQYEVWNRIYAYNLSGVVGEDAELLFRRIRFVEMSRTVLDRALTPFPITLRTLDALHLATMDHLKQLLSDLVLASYDHRLLAAAQVLGIDRAPL